MTAIGIRDDRFDFGRVFNRTLEVLKAEWLRFGLFILVVQSVPSMALQGVFVSQGLYGQPNRMLAIMQSPVIGLVGVLGLLIFLLTVAAQAALLWGAGARLADRKATTSEMIATGLRMILPMIGLSICLGAAVAIGFVLLIVPGVMMLLAWCVTGPALVIERRGVFGAFSRSADLTRGHRWAILGLFLVIFVAAVVVGAIVGLIVNPLIIGTMMAGRAAALTPIILIGLLIQGMWNAVVTTVSISFSAAVYYELRVAKEGIGPEALAAVFD